MQRGFKNSKIYKLELYKLVSTFATENWIWQFLKANFSLDNTYNESNKLPIATEDFHMLFKCF